MPYQGKKLMEWDIVQRLREGRTNGSNLVWGVSAIHREAADEIERLREALRKVMDLSHRRTTHPMSDEADYYRIARAALGEEK